MLQYVTPEGLDPLKLTLSQLRGLYDLLQAERDALAHNVAGAYSLPMEEIHGKRAQYVQLGELADAIDKQRRAIEHPHENELIQPETSKADSSAGY